MTNAMPSPDQPLKIGTRGSPLALAQAYETRARLMRVHGLPQTAFEIVTFSTRGDRVLDRSLRELGGKGLFSKELEVQLAAGDVDIAVHSTKDMAVDQPEGLILDTFLERENPLDAFLSFEAKQIADLPEGAIVGTSSLRRKAQLLNKRPDLNVVEFRGTVETRLQKLSDGVARATFLAMAGLNRLGREDLPKTEIPSDEMLPALAQGVISIERRLDDSRVADLLAPLNHTRTAVAMQAERAFLKELDGSCQTPIAGLAEVEGDVVTLRGEVLRTDGSASVMGQKSGPVEAAAQMGVALAKELLAEAGPNFFDWRD